MNTTYQHAVVLGLGASGVAAARLLRAEGTAVTVMERALSPTVESSRREVESLGVRVMAGECGLPSEPFDLCVVSPGVPLNAPWQVEARARGIPVLAEMELGWSRRAPATRVVAVTGSNGKSNAVKWLAEALAEAGYAVALGGNYGPPVCRVVHEHRSADWLVLEVSSFQLETTRVFRADLGILLNLVPNHLDRHGDLDSYRAAKARLFAHLQAGDVALVHEDCLAWLPPMPAGADRRSFGRSDACDYRYQAGRVECGARVLADLSGSYFGNDVLGVNAAGVLGALDAGGLNVAAADRVARVFRPLPHRMETVAEARGIRFINDSKATTLAALSAAVRMCGGNVRLIAGGLLKEKDLGPAKEVLAQRAAGVYLIGKASEPMASAWSAVTRCVLCETLAVAVEAAWRDAQPGETILLSPGCASFDQFRNFEERGERFSRAARALSGEK